MRIEVLCTGNELLDGTVLDTTATWFCERAFARGAPVSRKETLPDDLPVLVEAFRQMGERADFVVVSGGLGPTIDDITLDAAAQAAGVPLEEDVAILARLKQRFAERGFVFTPNNARQARVPRGGTAVHNPHGTAPMMILKVGRADCFLLPGVPREFRGLCDEQVIPRLEARLAAETGRAHYASRVLKLFGIGESMADDRVKDLPVRHPHVQVGFRTHLPENHLKLLAQGATDEEARARLAAAEADARALVGEKIFGVDHDEFPAVVFRALKAAGATVALAESCLQGGIGAKVEIPPDLSPVVGLFSETQARALVSVAPEKLAEFTALARETGVPVRVLGKVGGDSLSVTGLFELSLAEMSDTYENALEKMVAGAHH